MPIAATDAPADDVAQDRNEGPSAADLDAASESIIDELVAKNSGDAVDNPQPGSVGKPVDKPAEEAAGNGSSFDIPEDVVQPAPKKEEPAVKSVEVADPKFKDPKQNHAFAQLRHELTEARKELEQLKAKPSVSDEDIAQRIAAKEAEIEQRYKEQVTQLEERLGQYDLASTKAFRSKYDEPLNGLLQRAVNLVVKAGVSQEDATGLVQQMMNKPTVERAQELGELVPAIQGAVVNLFEDFDEIRGQRDAALKNWKESKAASGEEELRIGQARAIELAETLVGQVVKQQEEVGNPFFRRSQAKPDWNAGVDERVAKLKGLLKSGDQVVLANLIAEGLTAQEYRQLYQATRAKLQELEKSVQDRFGMIPGFSGRRDAGSPPPARSAQKTDEEILQDLESRHMGSSIRGY